MPEHAAPLDCWAIVEVMGHKRFAGHVTEQLFGSASLIRVDVPETEQPAERMWNGERPPRTTASYSKLVGVSSIYCITPCTEEVARACAVQIERDNDPIPVALPVARQLSAVLVEPPGDDYDAESWIEDDEDDEDDEEPRG